MRILVASDRIGALGSARAGRVIARGWPEVDATVVPVGEAGRGFVEAAAQSAGAVAETVADPGGLTTLARTDRLAVLGWERAVRPGPGIPSGLSSAPLGEALLGALEGRPRRVYVDLAGGYVHDAGAGLLAALGARADVPLDGGAGPLGRLARLDLGPARELLTGVELVGVVPQSQLAAQLLGLRGITARLGREYDTDPATMLAIDGALERFAMLVDPGSATAPGSGACGGLGFAVSALGGRLVSGPSVTLPHDAAHDRPDLVLTGCAVFDFARRGGGVVAEVADLAGRLLAPCVLLAGEVYVGGREMRAMGIEAAYPIRPDGPGDGGAAPGEPELAALATRVARTGAGDASKIVPLGNSAAFVGHPSHRAEQSARRVAGISGHSASGRLPARLGSPTDVKEIQI